MSIFSPCFDFDAMTQVASVSQFPIARLDQKLSCGTMLYLAATCNSPPGSEALLLDHSGELDMLCLPANSNSPPGLETFLLHNSGLHMLYLSANSNSPPRLETLLLHHSGELDMLYAVPVQQLQ